MKVLICMIAACLCTNSGCSIAAILSGNANSWSTLSDIRKKEGFLRADTNFADNPGWGRLKLADPSGTGSGRTISANPCAWFAP
jgi:hypothetical protein